MLILDSYTESSLKGKYLICFGPLDGAIVLQHLGHKQPPSFIQRITIIISKSVLSQIKPNISFLAVLCVHRSPKNKPLAGVAWVQWPAAQVSCMSLLPASHFSEYFYQKGGKTSIKKSSLCSAPWPSRLSVRTWLRYLRVRGIAVGIPLRRRSPFAAGLLLYLP